MKGAAAVPPSNTSPPSRASEASSGISQYFLFWRRNCRNSRTTPGLACAPAFSKAWAGSSDMDGSELPIVLGGIGGRFGVEPIRRRGAIDVFAEGAGRAVAEGAHCQSEGREQQEVDRGER